MRKLLLLLSTLLAPWIAYAADFDHTHRAFAAVLERHVQTGRVDYAALNKDSAPLRAYLDQLGAVSTTEFARWTTNQQLAFLINLYNATTLKLVADHYPVQSIKDIGGFFRGPWKQPIVRVFGQTVTLDHVEYVLLLERFREPRIHFALVCAALGCPELRAEPFVPDRLDEQIDEQGRKFLADPAKNRIDVPARTAYLSPIFKWFASDFESRSGSVLKFIQPYLAPSVRTNLQQTEFRIRYTRYNWDLNDREPAN
jgi:hypothetical protein